LFPGKGTVDDREIDITELMGKWIIPTIRREEQFARKRKLANVCGALV
jgi:hypothetical protein